MYTAEKFLEFLFVEMLKIAESCALLCGQHLTLLKQADAAAAKECWDLRPWDFLVRIRFSRSCKTFLSKPDTFSQRPNGTLGAPNMASIKNKGKTGTILAKLKTFLVQNGLLHEVFLPWWSSFSWFFHVFFSISPAFLVDFVRQCVLA